MGVEVTEGLGAGSQPEVGHAAAECQIASKSDPFSLARATPSEGAKTGVAEPHIAEQSAGGEWRAGG
jgi:cell division GTPase FtsZ